eukprot:TRINITY_DN1414_c0_g1_i1.p1 TRINITY_DN1414_c0_g1~~TRINITY_DN1414_c0_g1_i1.p1  ORF type:complete len:173 (-),score=23.61 TRINITY_DN1414_c0_g1_i1:200-718(-)
MGNTPHKVLMFGLDNGGKTTILHQLSSEVTETRSVPGFGFESAKYKSLEIFSWDGGGSDTNTYKLYSRGLQKGSHGIIFVVDSTDRDRIGESCEELCRYLKEDALKNLPVLIFWNKVDVSGSMPIAEVSQRLLLGEFQNKFVVQPCCAITGEGLNEGLEQLVQIMSEASSWI